MSMSSMPIMGGPYQARPDLGPNVGFGAGLPMQSGQNPVAEQTQQMANNPIYGQESPFQPPRQQPGMPAVIGGDDPMGMNMGGLMGGKGGFGGPGQLVGGPAGQPILGPGQRMPEPMMPPGGSVGQQPIPLPMMYNFVGGGDTGNNAPMQTGRPLQGTLPGSNIPYTIANEPITPPNRGQLVGGPAGQPIMGGGLKPQPRNYRAPMRSGGILRQRLR
jgi:hypothetical protein